MGLFDQEQEEEEQSGEDLVEQTITSKPYHEAYEEQKLDAN